MASDRPDPGEFLERAQRMLRELFGEQGGEDEPGQGAARPRERATAGRAHREPSPGEQRENLTFALATRAVEALEDLALNVAAIRQRLERTERQSSGAGREDRRPDGDDAGRGPVER